MTTLKSNTWILLKSRFDSSVTVVQINEVTVNGVWVLYPRNPEVQFLPTQEFDARFSRIVLTREEKEKAAFEKRMAAAGYDFLTRARFRKYAGL